MPVILATEKAEIRRITVQSQHGQRFREILSQKNPSQNKAGRVAQVVDCLPNKCEALSSNPSAIHTQKRHLWVVLRQSQSHYFRATPCFLFSLFYPKGNSIWPDHPLTQLCAPEWLLTVSKIHRGSGLSTLRIFKITHYCHTLWACPVFSSLEKPQKHSVSTYFSTCYMLNTRDKNRDPLFLPQPPDATL
jgi:hypothetical protein